MNYEGIQALRRLHQARTGIWNYLLERFDPDQELEETRNNMLQTIGEIERE